MLSLPPISPRTDLSTQTVRPTSFPRTISPPQICCFLACLWCYTSLPKLHRSALPPTLLEKELGGSKLFSIPAWSFRPSLNFLSFRNFLKFWEVQKASMVYQGSPWYWFNSGRHSFVFRLGQLVVLWFFFQTVFLSFVADSNFKSIWNSEKTASLSMDLFCIPVRLYNELHCTNWRSMTPIIFRIPWQSEDSENIVTGKKTVGTCLGDLYQVYILVSQDGAS